MHFFSKNTPEPNKNLEFKKNHKQKTKQKLRRGGIKKFFLVLRMFQKNIRGTRKRKMEKLLSRTFSPFAPPAADIFLPLSPLLLPCSTCGAPFPLPPLVFFPGCACGVQLCLSFSSWVRLRRTIVYLIFSMGNHECFEKHSWIPIQKSANF